MYRNIQSIMADEDKPCIECNVPGYFPTVKQLTPRTPDSCTARACYKAAKITAKASLCWLWCGGASILTFIIILLLSVILIPVAVLLFPFLLIYVIGVLLMLLVQCIRECICGTNTPGASKPKRTENTKKEKEKEGEYVLRCCGNCTASGNLVYILILLVSIPTAIVLMLVALVYLLMAGVLWCCGIRGKIEATTQSPVDLPQMPVYSQTIDCDYSFGRTPGYFGRLPVAMPAEVENGTILYPDVYIAMPAEVENRTILY